MDACENALESAVTPPKIEIYTVAVLGTYDDLRAAAVGERINLMRVQLFAEVLPAERLVQLPPGAQEQVSNIRIDFRPSL